MSFLVRKVIAFNEHHQKKALQRAKLLIHNILPDEVIPMLRRRGPKQIGALANAFDEVAIMFVNITNLNDIISQFTSEQAFRFYNEIITRFDEATRKSGLLKIKTVNTTYMVAAGLPRDIPKHTELALNLAMEFMRIVHLFTEREGNRETPRIRVGMEVGPVIAGIVGKKKFAYDCWSETVNEAARLETTGLEGYAHVSSNVYELLHDKFSFTQAKESGNRATFMCRL